METLQAINELKIETNKIFYDKKTQILSIYIFDFIFIGNYKKSAKIDKILDDIYKSLGDTQLKRANISFVDFVTLTPISENTKLKNLNLISKKEKEGKKEEAKEKEVMKVSEELTMLSEITKDKELRKKSKKAYDFKEKEDRVSAPKAKKKQKGQASKAMKYVADEDSIDEDMFMEEARSFDDAPSEAYSSTPAAPAAPSRPSIAPSAPPPKAAGAPGGGPPKKAKEDLGGFEGGPKSEEEVEEEKPLRSAEPAREEPQTTTYDINMGLQYYSVMMEQSSYLFYVYLSHKELKIVDDEGKIVFQTSFRIVTTKKEPPIVTLKVEGEGFSVHPLFGRVEISKDAVNPPVMIFSVLPIKKKDRTKKEKKMGERRHLRVYIEFEDNVINHSVLSVIVQPKHFRLDIGPFHLNMSKKTAAVISLLSIIVAAASLIFTIISFDPQSTLVDNVGNFAPGLGSLIFVTIFLVTLFKEGIYPLKAKISYFLNFDNAGLIK